MAASAPRQGLAFVYVTTLFFIWGAVTSVNDVLIPAVKEIFTLTDTQGRWRRICAPTRSC